MRSVLIAFVAASIASAATATWFQLYRPPVTNLYTVAGMKQVPAAAVVVGARTQVKSIDISSTDGDPVVIFSDGTACLRPVVSGWLSVGDSVTVSGTLGMKVEDTQWFDRCEVDTGRKY
jgi:hypothetical protein